MYLLIFVTMFVSIFFCSLINDFDWKSSLFSCRCLGRCKEEGNCSEFEELRLWYHDWILIYPYSIQYPFVLIFLLQCFFSILFIYLINNFFPMPCRRKEKGSWSAFEDLNYWYIGKLSRDVWLLFGLQAFECFLWIVSTMNDFFSIAL